MKTRTLNLVNNKLKDFINKNYNEDEDQVWVENMEA